MIYLDNAATSHPKPPETVQWLTRFVESIGGNPGRSGHDSSVAAARIIFDAREKLSRFINSPDSRQVIFTQNGTESLNMALFGLLREGDHVITTSMEHNSVMRPLTYLHESRHIDLTVIECDRQGTFDPDILPKEIRKNTRAFVVNHGSNIIGSVQPLGALRKRIGDDIVFIVDACQTIGSVPIDVRADGIDILCFSCHKSLMGLQGTGAIYIRPGLDLTPLKFGGTGSKSEHIDQPDFLPDMYESGTPNTPGIAALLGSFEFIEKAGFDAIVAKKQDLRRRILSLLASIDGVTVYGGGIGETALPVVSINLHDKLPSETGYELNRRGIHVRIGLHCSPIAHKTIGTFPSGTVRISPGYFTTEEDLKTFAEALKEIARS